MNEPTQPTPLSTEPGIPAPAQIGGPEILGGLFGPAPVCHFVVDRAGILLQANQSTARLLHVSEAQLPGKPFAQFITTADQPIWEAFLGRVLAGQPGQACEVSLPQTGETRSSPQFPGSPTFKQVDARVMRIEAAAAENRQCCYAAMMDISEHRRVENQHEAERELLRICHFANTTAELIRELTRYFQQLTGCQAVGVRLQQGGDFPYFETNGFPPAFVEAERSLCSPDQNGQPLRDSSCNPVLECMCGNVLRGRVNPAKPFFTPHGSFWTSCTTELLTNTTNADRMARTRNRCNGEGFESVALIPLRARGSVYGLFQFNDRRRGCFSRESIEFLEHLVDFVALALANLQSVEALRESEEKYRQLVENAGETIYVVQNGRFQFVNPKAEEVSGYTTAELTSKLFLDVVHPDDRQITLERHQRRLQGDNIPISTLRILHKSGETRWVEVKAATIRWAGQPATLNFLTDITQRKQLEEISARNAQVLRLFVEFAPAAIAMFDREMRYIAASQRYLQDYHLQQKNITGYSHYEIFPEISARWKEIHQRCQAGAIEKCAADPFPRADGTLDWVRWEIHPWYETPESIGGILLFSEVITAQKQAEDELRLSEARFRALAELLPVGIYLADPAGNCLYANPKWLETAGQTPEEALGPGWLRALHPEDRPLVFAAWNKMVASQGEWGLEYRFCTPTGKVTWVYGLAAELKNEKDHLIGMVGANIDITESKRMQDSLQASVAEKDVLLREVHHRVKNNLAAILGLLEMERQAADTGAGHTLITNLANRITAMSTIHEKLYQSQNLSKINFEEYLNSFLVHLRTSYPSTGHLTSLVQAPEIELGLDVAVPCGLIVNELVTNALKYAFPTGKPGLPGAEECRINVSMTSSATQYTLSVSDNGVGLPPGFDWRSTHSMGLRLVRMLGEHQLGGQITLDSTQGTLFTLIFDGRQRI